jgi:hypothetical protein
MNRLQRESAAKRTFQSAIALIAWFAVILHFFLSGVHLVNFLSYFTILCNLLIAASLSISSINPRSGIGAFFSGYSYQSALTVYILIVALIYNFVLRGTWSFVGWLKINNNLLHVVVPVFFFIYWIAFIPKGSLKWKNNWSWMIFPLIYLVYTLIRGEIIHWYPYPFINVIKHGYGQVFLNSAFVSFGFILMGFLLIGINRFIGKRIKADPEVSGQAAAD